MTERGDGGGAREVARAIKAQAEARELAQAVADQAGRIAETMCELARVREEMGESARSRARADEAWEGAARVRGFADHERGEQQRWGNLKGPE